MHLHRKRRLYFIILILLGVGITVSLGLYALRQNINLYYTPTQVKKMHLSGKRDFRIGGMVMKGTVHRVPDSLKISFAITDYHSDLTIKYNGMLPSLFRVGQGIVAQGHLNAQGVFVADQLLAKHDSTYRPPEIPKANKTSGVAQLNLRQSNNSRHIT